MIPLAVPIIVSVPIILVAVLMWFIPQLTRPDLYFAVTVDPTFRDTPEGRDILRRYQRDIIALALLSLPVVLLLFIRTSALAPAALYLELIVSFAVFVRARRRVLPHAVAPTTIREAALDGRQRIVPGGWVVAAGPFIVLADTATYLWQHAGGVADAEIAALLAGATPVAIIALVLYGLGHWVRAVYVGGALGAGEVRFRRTVATLLLAIQYAVAIQWSFVAMVRHYDGVHVGTGIGLAVGFVPLAIVVVGTFALARLGQGGSGGLHGASAAPVGDRIPDRYWRLGVFYINRDDPALFVEKRFGLGYTLNFGHAVSWLIILVPLVLAVAVPLVRYQATTAASHAASATSSRAASSP